jgi:uncharacterized protein (DUF2236 family)
MPERPDGYFPRGKSVLRQVHDERIVGLVYGQRALMVGAIDPVVSTGTYEVSKGSATPFDRLARTAKIFETIFTGSREDADAALERVHRLHSRVQGELARDAGPFPAGTPYDALDPRQMLWTMACIADSGQVVYERLVRPLGDAERDALWEDYKRFGELFGMPRSVMPERYADFREWFDGRLAGDEVFLTDESYEIGRIVALEIPGPPHDRPALAMFNLLVIGLLPDRVREMYGLRWSAAHRAAFRAAVAAHRAAHPLVPNRIRQGPCEWSYDRVARAERRYGRRQAQRTTAAASARRESVAQD